MDDNTNSDYYPPKNYSLSGKIMLIMVIVLFTVVITMVFLHLYARWYLIQARRRLNLRRRHQSRTTTHLVFYADPNNNGPGAATANRGLDPSVLKSLPVFVYGYESMKEMAMTMKTIECAVCLSEFEDNDTVRCLPMCNHCFHIDCIDMWFHSHSTCPLCRSPVEINEAGTESVNDDHVVLAVNETTAEDVSGSSSGYCSSCRHDEEGTNRVQSYSSSSLSSSSLFGMRRKPPPLVMPIEVPRRTGDDFGAESPGNQSYKSPVGRIRSFKRIMSRGSPSPSGGGGTSWGPSELDIERGGDKLTPRNRVETPR